MSPMRCRAETGVKQGKSARSVPTVQSVAKAISVLRAFRHPDEWVGYGELAERANLPLQTAYRIVLTLLETGAVEKSENGYRSTVTWRR